MCGMHQDHNNISVIFPVIFQSFSNIFDKCFGIDNTFKIVWS